MLLAQAGTLGWSSLAALRSVVQWEKTGNCAKLEKLSALGENAAPERISIFDRK